MAQGRVWGVCEQREGAAHMHAPRRGSGDVPAVGSSSVLERHSGPASLHRAALHAPCAAVKTKAHGS